MPKINQKKKSLISYKDNELPFKKRKAIRDLWNKKSLNFKFFKKNKLIILNYTKINSNIELLWKGWNVKNNQSKLEPLILKFENEPFYFYPNGIQKKTKWRKPGVKSTEWIPYKSKLNYLDKEKVFKKFAEFHNEKNIYQQNLLLTLKINYLNDAIKVLGENLEEEKKLLNDKDNISVLETKLLDADIINLKNKIKFVQNKIYYLRKKITKNFDSNLITSLSTEFDTTNSITKQNISLANETDESKNLKNEIANEIKKEDTLINHLIKNLSNLFNHFEVLKKELEENKQSLNLSNSCSELDKKSSEKISKKLEKNNLALNLDEFELL